MGRTTSTAVVNGGASSLFAAPRCLPSLPQTRASSATGPHNSPTSLGTRDPEVYNFCQLRLKQIIFCARASYNPSSLQRTLFPPTREQGTVGSTSPPVTFTRMSPPVCPVEHIASWRAQQQQRPPGPRSQVSHLDLANRGRSSSSRQARGVRGKLVVLFLAAVDLLLNRCICTRCYGAYESPTQVQLHDNLVVSRAPATRARRHAVTFCMTRRRRRPYREGL